MCPRRHISTKEGGGNRVHDQQNINPRLAVGGGARRDFRNIVSRPCVTVRTAIDGGAGAPRLKLHRRHARTPLQSQGGGQRTSLEHRQVEKAVRRCCGLCAARVLGVDGGLRREPALYRDVCHLLGRSEPSRPDSDRTSPRLAYHRCHENKRTAWAPANPGMRAGRGRLKGWGAVPPHGAQLVRCALV